MLVTHPYSTQNFGEVGCCNSVLEADETLKDKHVVVGRAHVITDMVLKNTLVNPAEMTALALKQVLSNIFYFILHKLVLICK
jgi:hypothetical protein